MIHDKIKQPFLDLFPGDRSYNLMQRQTPDVLYSLVKPIGFPKSKMIHYNQELMNQLGFDTPLPKELEDLLNAKDINEINSYATAYAGHQFGHWAGQLGDGRAILIGEVKDIEGQSIELQWKGAGATTYSRHADGRAVLRSTIREYLMSEAMFHLGIPTTRSLSISLSGEQVLRDMMYNGNFSLEPGAVMVRTAPSFIRFGHFEFLAANNKIDTLKSLADYIIQHHYKNIDINDENRYLTFFSEVLNRTLDMIIEWYRIGFVHGVMNTDNMSILGLSIDYGPFAMMEEYDLKFTSNTTDLPGRRYAFGQQGNMALWNLNALANALFPLIKDEEALQNAMNVYEIEFWKRFDKMMALKLGLNVESDNQSIIRSWQVMMTDTKADYTLFFIELMKYRDDKNSFTPSNFLYSDLSPEQVKRLNDFLAEYDKTIDDTDLSIQKMHANNPQFILRNYLLFNAIQNAEKGDYNEFEILYEALKNPYQKPEDRLQSKRPDWANEVPGCSMLSCSS